MTTLEEVCAEHGLVPPEQRFPGLEVRLDDVSKPGQEDGFLVLFADGCGGFIQNHRNEDDGASFFFNRSMTRMNADHMAQVRIARERRAAEREAEHAQAAFDTWQIWNAAEPADPAHPYLDRKQAKIAAGTLGMFRAIPERPGLLRWLQLPILVAPVMNARGYIQTLEYIGADGDRRYHPGGRKEGGFCVIGAQKWKTPGVHYVAEGLTTAASISLATDRPCACAFDAGNMPKVAEAILREADLPYGSSVVICGDDDVALERQGKKNKGRIKAEEAARLIGAVVALPDFTRLPERGDLSDFNDLAVRMGADEVRKQLEGTPSTLPERPEWLQDPLHDLSIDFGEADIAGAFARLQSDSLRYVNAWRSWMHYENGKWSKEDTLAAYNKIDALCRELIATRPNVKGAAALRKASTRGGVERIAQADRRLAATVKQWDRDDWMLNTPSGVVNLRSGELVAHEPNQYMTMQTRASPGGFAPRWMQFLDEITCGDRPLAEYLQRLCGYVLTGATMEQILTFFWGGGANGKGTFVDVIADVLGGYYRSTGSETLTESRFDRHKSELAVLKGVRLVTSSEIDQGKIWAEKRIKELTGQDPIEANFMRCDPFTFLPNFKLIIAANNKPRFTVVDQAIRRRLQLVPFLADFEASGRKDKNLREHMKTEGAGILQWMVEGCLWWQRDGLAPPQSVLVATSDYLDGEDLEGNWIEEHCIADPTGQELLSTLFDDWCRYASSRHGRSKRDRDLLDRLSRDGFRKEKTVNGPVVYGLRLRKGGETTFPNVINFPSR